MGPKKKGKKDFREFETFEEEDITDSEDGYSEGELELLEKVRKKRVQENFDSDDEVFALQNAEVDETEEFEGPEEHDSMESDMEEAGQQDEDLPDDKAWGKRKRNYFRTDYVDQDYRDINEKDLTEGKLEGQEATSIQQGFKSHIKNLSFGVAKGKFVDKNVETKLEKVKDLLEQGYTEKDSPELESLIDSFKERMTEAKNILSPLLKLAQEENWPNCRALDLIKTKYQLILNYCVNINFYLILKAKKISILNHPVMKRLAQYSNLIGQLEEGQDNLLEEASKILQAKCEGQMLYHISDEVENTETMEKHKLSVSEGSDDEEDDDNDEEHDKNEEIIAESINEPALEFDDEKRPINYQIAKNKGLTPHRKKEQRNPRVKHRNKYKKAKIRRKGAVREVRKELSRYGGEMSGIKASVKKSIKIK